MPTSRPPKKISATNGRHVKILVLGHNAHVGYDMMNQARTTTSVVGHKFTKHMHSIYGATKTQKISRESPKFEKSIDSAAVNAAAATKSMNM